MAYKQKSTPFKQEKGYTPRLGKAIEENTKKNKWLNEVESSAKKDSTTASIDRLKSGGTKFQAGLQGNLAANKTRQLNNAWDLTVDRGRTSELYGSTAGGPNTATYTRRKPTVEKDVKMARNKKGELDIAPTKQLKKSSPAKQTKNPKYKGSTEMGSMGMAAGGEANTDLLKVAKDYVKKGVSKVGKALGYRDTSGDDSRYSDKIKKSSPGKQLKKHSVAKMKKC